MKNLKVNKKIFLSLCIIVCLSLIIAIGGGTGMRVLKGHINTLVDKTIPNTEHIMEMRINTNAEAKELLLALNTKEMKEVEAHLEEADRRMKKNDELLETISSTLSIDDAIITKLSDCIAAQDAARKEFYQLIELGTKTGDAKAKVVLEERLIPQFACENGTLKEISAEQEDLNNARINSALKIYKILILILIILVLVGIVLTIIVSKILIKSIIPPLKMIEDATVALSKGDFDVDVDYDSKDEFGITCRALKTSQRILKEVIKDECRILGEMSEGNFNVSSNVSEAYVGELEPINRSIEKITKDLSEMIMQVNNGAEEVAAGANQVATGAQALAQGATEQASTVEEISAELNELSNRTQNNVQTAENVMELSKVSGDKVNESADDIDEMIKAMADISSSSQKIEQIIAAIENIAFQTNILALNAAVEAARAGEAGKGFAVVADEVRNLASKSDESAKATKELISESINAVKNGEEIVDRVASALEATKESTNAAVDEIISIVNEIKEDANEIQVIKNSVEQISSVVQTNSATSEESAAASEELSSQANLIKAMVGRFKVAGSNCQMDDCECIEQEKLMTENMLLHENSPSTMSTEQMNDYIYDSGIKY